MKASPLKRLYGLGQTNFVVVDHDGIIRYRSRDNYDDQADVLAIRSAIIQALGDLAAARATGQGFETALSAEPSLPLQFSLQANAPNPFNANTRLRFSLGVGGPISLEVFDISGRLVRQLVDQRWSAPGVYEVSWDGRNDRGTAVVSGVYIYRLLVHDQAATRKMLLVR